jgi:hypothetical protein
VAGVTEVKAVHLTQLRTEINTVRTAHGLSAYDWAVPSAAIEQFVTPIDHNHVLEMRTALEAVYTAAGVAVPDWDAPVVTSGPRVATPATDAHALQESGNALKRWAGEVVRLAGLRDRPTPSTSPCS